MACDGGTKMRSWGYCNVTSSARVQQASAGCAVCDVHSSSHTYCTTGVVHQLSWRLAADGVECESGAPPGSAMRLLYKSTKVYKVHVYQLVVAAMRSHAQPCAAINCSHACLATEERGASSVQRTAGPFTAGRSTQHYCRDSAGPPIGRSAQRASVAATSELACL